MEKIYYIIVTNYGFLLSVLEDFDGDYSPSDDMYYIYNLEFTDDISEAMTFYEKTDKAPKYAVSEKFYGDSLTIDKWVEEINGEVIRVKKIIDSNLKNDGTNNFYCDTKYEVSDSIYLNGIFSEHPRYTE